MSRRTAADFHNISNPKTDYYLKKELIRHHISKNDYEILLKFLAYKVSVDDIAESRYKKIAAHLVHWRRWIPEYTSCTIDDIIRGVQQLKTAEKQRGGQYAPNAIRDYISIMKMFFTWLKKKGYSDIDPKELAEIKLPKRQNKKEIIIFKPGAIDAMINACLRTKDKAMIGLLYEGGFRIGEIGTMQWSQIQIDKYGLILEEDFKTGKLRTLRLCECKQDLTIWMNEYSNTIGEPEGEAYVFLNQNDEPYEYAALNKHLHEIAIRGGVDTRFTSHSFRHTRVTDLIRAGVPLPVIGLMIWGDPYAPELATYSHLGFEDVNKAMLKLYNIKTAEEEPESLRIPRQCPECHEINPARAEYCYICTTPLSQNARDKLDAKIKKIREKPEYNQLVDAILEDT